jgi:serine/threonine-protein phosphatase 2B catalytic subunit
VACACVRARVWVSVHSVDAVKQFLTDNKLTSIIRAHEAQVDGYKMHMVNKSSGIPRVITIFSAPNYCDVRTNTNALAERSLSPPPDN